MSRPTINDVPSALPLASDRRRSGRPDLEHLAVVSLVAAATVAILRATEPFEHGIWLVAYLFLVGFLAQLLLGRGQAALFASAKLSGPPPVIRRAECVLWNFGVAIVPVGVLAETRLAVLLGTMAFVGALASFFGDVRPGLRGNALVGRSYLALLVLMAASAITGLALAWDIPWS